MSTVAKWLAFVLLAAPLLAAGAVAGILVLPRVIEALIQKLNPQRT